MKTMKRMLAAFLVLAALIGLAAVPGCTSGKERILIYTSSEEQTMEYMRTRLAQEFPEYECVLEYKDTGSHAATLLAEGKDTDCDITYDLEYGYLSQLEKAGILTQLSDYDFSVYTDDTVASKYYIPTLRNGGAIIVNPAVLQEKKLAVPQSYSDLLKPEYKGLISMPNPKSSGTGYMFLKSLVNKLGEDEAFAYFNKLSENVLSFTSSGSGPVNALKNKEAAIGLGMTAHAVMEINDGTDLDILFFEEGSPFSLCGMSIINGKKERESVKRVFDFLVNPYIKEANERFFPEKFFKDFAPEIENFPKNIRYSDMSNDSYEEKSRLLEKWNH